MSIADSEAAETAPSEDLKDEAKPTWQELVANKIRDHFRGVPPSERALQEKVIDLAWKNPTWLGCKAASISEFLRDQGFDVKEATSIALVLEISKVQQDR